MMKTNNQYYMTTGNYSLTQVSSGDTTSYGDLNGLLANLIDNRNFKTSITVHCFKLTEIATALIGKLMESFGFTQRTSEDFNVVNGKLNNREFCFIGSKVGDVDDTFRIKCCIQVSKSKNRFIYFKNLQAMTGADSIDMIKKSMNETDEIKAMVKKLNDMDKRGQSSITASTGAFNLMKSMCFGSENDPNGYNKFKDVFPQLPIEVHKFCEKSLKGGLNMARPELLGQAWELENGIMIDINSLYPTCAKEELIPYGQATYYEGTFNGPVKVKRGLFTSGIIAQLLDEQEASEEYVFIQRIKAKSIKIKDRGVPAVFNEKKKIMFEETNVELTLTSVDLELLLRNYDVVGLEYVDGYYFKAKRGMFDNFIDFFYDMKCNAIDELDRAYAKLNLNGFIGKFGTKLRQHNYFKKGRVTKEYAKYTLPSNYGYAGETVFNPVTCFVNAYGRQRLATAIENNFDSVAYFDTDSLILTQEPVGIEIDSKKMGAWKIEGHISKMIISGKKQYCLELTDGTLKTAVAGLTTKDKEDQIRCFEDFIIGKEYVNNFELFDIDGNVYSKQEKFTLSEDYFKTLSDIRDEFFKKENL